MKKKLFISTPINENGDSIISSENLHRIYDLIEAKIGEQCEIFIVPGAEFVYFSDKEEDKNIAVLGVDSEEELFTWVENL